MEDSDVTKSNCLKKHGRQDFFCAAWEIVTFDCVKKSFEEAEIVQKQGNNEEPSFDVEELDGFFGYQLLTGILSMEKIILIQIDEIKTLTPGRAVDWLIGRNALIPC